MPHLPRGEWPQTVRLLNFLKEIKGKPTECPPWCCWVGACSTAVLPGAALECIVQPTWCAGRPGTTTLHTHSPQGGGVIKNVEQEVSPCQHLCPQPNPTGGMGGEHKHWGMGNGPLGLEHICIMDSYKHRTALLSRAQAG